MSDYIFPLTLPGVDIKITRAPMFSSLLQQAGARTLAHSWYEGTPKYRFTVKFNVLREAGATELETVMLILSQHYGEFDSFLLRDPYDNVLRRVRFEAPALETERIVFDIWKTKDIGLIEVWDPEGVTDPDVEPDIGFRVGYIHHGYVDGMIWLPPLNGHPGRLLYSSSDDYTVAAGIISAGSAVDSGTFTSVPLYNDTETQATWHTFAYNTVGNTRTIVVGAFGSGAMLVGTDDGETITWARPALRLPGDVWMSIFAVTYGDGKWVGVGHYGAGCYSTDNGVTWTTFNGTGTAVSYYSAKAIRWTGSKWLMIVQCGAVGAFKVRVFWSDTFTDFADNHWSYYELPGTAYVPDEGSGFATNGAGIYLIAGSTGRDDDPNRVPLLYKSTNPASTGWEDISDTLPALSGGDITGIYYLGNTFVILTNIGLVLTSTDGETWDSITVDWLSPPQYWASWVFAATYTGSTLVIAGYTGQYGDDPGVMLYSPF